VKANVATLVKLVTQKGRETQIKQGDFLFSFNIDVTR
jgi:hypothetical protein